MAHLIDPVVLFFVLGVVAGLVKSDLRVPLAFYNTLSIYLLLSIGIKGGIELYHTQDDGFWLPAIGTVTLGCLITFIAYAILYSVGRLDKPNAIAIAAHYGSVSAVTFAVVLTYLNDRNVYYEEFMTVLLVLLEIPAILVAIMMAKTLVSTERTNLQLMFYETFFGKSMYLLIGGLFIGIFTAYTGNKQLNFFFFDLFKGFLAIFMLQMGIVASEKVSSLKKIGPFLIFFALTMPLLSSVLGILTGILCGLSMGGTVVLATMAASASYIAAPAAMRLALPQANATYYLTAAIGITFPFNITVGIQLYYKMTEWIYGWLV